MLTPYHLMKLQKDPQETGHIEAIRLITALPSQNQRISIHNLPLSLRVDHKALGHDQVRVSPIIDRSSEKLMPPPHIIASVNERIRNRRT